MQTAAHSPDVDDEEEAWCRYSQLQFTPISYEVCHPSQYDVSKAKEVIGDYTSQHAFSRPCPFSTCVAGTHEYTAKHPPGIKPSQ